MTRRLRLLAALLVPHGLLLASVRFGLLGPWWAFLVPVVMLLVLLQALPAERQRRLDQEEMDRELEALARQPGGRP